MIVKLFKVFFISAILGNLLGQEIMKHDSSHINAATSSCSRYARTLLPTIHGEFHCLIYRTAEGIEHLALCSKNLDKRQKIYCRIQSECLTSEVFGSTKCDCKQQLDLSLEVINQQQGVLIYLRQEGRGIGLGNKIRAYALQENGLDTVDANRVLGFSDDAREYQCAVDILNDLQISSVQLLTNNPQKVAGLQKGGITVEARQPLLGRSPSLGAMKYLKTKEKRMGHLIQGHYPEGLAEIAHNERMPLPLAVNDKFR